MKRLTLSALISALPVAALAHGGHAPVPEAAHGMVHFGPLAGLALIATAAVLALMRRTAP